MSKAHPIHDLFIRRVSTKKVGSEVHWEVMQESDHLLRRFALAEVVRGDPDLQPTLQLRSVADEVWALIEGRVEFRWQDMRASSPTQGTDYSITCSEPTLVLAPFGVAFGFRPLGGPALLLRLATHAEGTHDGDQRMPWETAT